MSVLQTAQEVVDLAVFGSDILAVVLVLVAGWVIANAPNIRLHDTCCRRRHPSLTHEMWLSEAGSTLRYPTPLALQVYGVPWLTIQEDACRYGLSGTEVLATLLGTRRRTWSSSGASVRLARSSAAVRAVVVASPTSASPLSAWTPPL